MEPENKHYQIVIPDNATPEDLVVFMRWWFCAAKAGLFPIGQNIIKDEEYESMQFKDWFRRV